MTVKELKERLIAELNDLNNYNDNDIVMNKATGYSGDGFPYSNYSEIKHPFRYNLIVNEQEYNRIVENNTIYKD